MVPKRALANTRLGVNFVPDMAPLAFMLTSTSTNEHIWYLQSSLRLGQLRLEELEAWAWILSGPHQAEPSQAGLAHH